MKNKIKFAGLLTLFLLVMSFKSHAYTLMNKLNCDVVVFYEMRTGGCGVCTSGSIVVPAMGTAILPTCAGYVGMCLIITNIGGATPPPNHIWVGIGPVCHVLVPYGQSGTTNCGPSGNFNVITPNPNTWVINP